MLMVHFIVDTVMHVAHHSLIPQPSRRRITERDAPMKLTAQHFLDQAAMAEQFARSLPVGDVRGYCEAMIDAKSFRSEAMAMLSSQKGGAL